MFNCRAPPRCSLARSPADHNGFADGEHIVMGENVVFQFAQILVDVRAV